VFLEQTPSCDESTDANRGKEERADYVIDNSGSLDQTRSQVAEIYGMLAEDPTVSTKERKHCK